MKRPQPRGASSISQVGLSGFAFICLSVIVAIASSPIPVTVWSPFLVGLLGILLHAIGQRNLWMACFHWVTYFALDFFVR